jgi:heme O synthase-like polyprenyltransferase
MKVRLNSLVVFTTAGGYYMAAGDRMDALGLVGTCLSTALVASGAAGLNQVAERDVDVLMNRTQSRPVAAGRMTPATGRMISLGLALLGLAGLVLLANRKRWLAVVTFLTYLHLHAAKRDVALDCGGAVPALPPLIGLAAGGISLCRRRGRFPADVLVAAPAFPGDLVALSRRLRPGAPPMLAVVDSDGR